MDFAVIADDLILTFNRKKTIIIERIFCQTSKIPQEC